MLLPSFVSVRVSLCLVQRQPAGSEGRKKEAPSFYFCMKCADRHQVCSKLYPKTVRDLCITCSIIRSHTDQPNRPRTAPVKGPAQHPAFYSIPHPPLHHHIPHLRRRRRRSLRRLAGRRRTCLLLGMVVVVAVAVAVCV